MSDELRRFLVKAVLDDAFRELARREPERAFDGFALADDEKDALRERGPSVLGLLGRAIGAARLEPRKEEAPAPAPSAAPTAVALGEIAFLLKLAPRVVAGPDGRPRVAWITSVQPPDAPPPAPVAAPVTPPDAAPLARAVLDAKPADRLARILDLIRAIEAGAPTPEVVARGSVDVWVVGLGIVAADHLTRETERALTASREVLFVDTGVATGPLLETFCPRVTSLFEESYKGDSARVAAYHHMAARTIEAALDHGPVAFAMQGHPLVGAYASPLIVALAAHLGLSARALAGVSSLDCLLADLAIDPMRTGLQAFEATDLLLRRRTIAPEVPVLIWQVGTVETRLHSTRPSAPARFARLRDHLLLFFPPHHPVTAYFASPHPLMESWRATFALASLPDQAPVLHAGVTLVIPPAREAPIQDADLLAKLDSEEHLRRITL